MNCRLFAASLLATLALFGCGPAPGGEDGGVPPSDAGETPDADAGVDAGTPPPLTVTFMAHDDEGGEAPATSLLYSLPFRVQVTGARPNEAVEVTARLQNLLAEAVFIASSEGEVNTATDAPLDGHYTGADPEGLLWSMTPAATTIGSTFDVTVEARTRDGVALATLQRLPMGSGTTQTSVMAGELPGRFWKYPGPTQRPAVLVLGGSECSLSSTEFTAAWVTTQGVHALAVDYCEQGTIVEVPLERLVAALDWLGAQPEVDASRLAVFGGSRGGELALQLAALDDRLEAVVASVPSPYRWGDTRDGTRSAWSLQGAPLAAVPTVPGAQPEVETLPSGGVAYRFTPTFLADLAAATPAQKAAATIDVAAAAGAILLVGAEDDGVWPSCAFVEDAWAQLTAAGHPTAHPEDAWLCLPEAGHGLGPPGWPTAGGYAFFHPQLGASLVMGGTDGGRGRANRAFDSAWRALFRRTLQAP